MKFIEFISHFKKTKKTKDGWIACCPAHEDKDPSLSITQSDDKILLHCHAGCSVEQIVEKIGLKMSDLFIDKAVYAEQIKAKSKIVATYDYTDEKGKTLFSVVRFDPKNFKQKTEKGWGTKGVRKVLYRLPKIIAAVAAKKEIFIVEGEKDVHSLETAGHVATTSPGGADKWREEYNSFFKGAKVKIIPDNDEAGRKHGIAVSTSLTGIAESVEILKLVGVKDITNWIEAGHAVEELTSKKTEFPFDVLGYINPPHQIVYRRKDNCEIIALGYNSHKKENLLQLAPYQFWVEASGGDKIDALKMQDILSTIAHKAGRFHPDKIRGYGAWVDDGRHIYNNGENLRNLKTKYFYRIDYPCTDNVPASIQPGIKDVFSKLGFNRGDQMLLGGWCCVAPLCGAMRWRPHVWITADHGAGKSVILDKIVVPIVGKCLIPASNTTEAGIRQALDCNAVPIVFDEAEGKTKTSNDNMQKVLELARKASGNNNSITYKGTTSGKAFSFSIHSMFCFASINPPITEQSDISRISILYYNRLNAEKWTELSMAISENITPKNCSALRNLSISNMENIFASIEIIHSWINTQAGNARFADQYAPLLAGWWHLDNIKPISIEEAEKLFMEAFSDNTSRIDDIHESDCEKCLEDIMTIGLPIGGGKIESIRTLLKKWKESFDVGSENVQNILQAYGISISKDFQHIYIHESNTEFKRLLARTVWISGIGKVLKRLPGVVIGYKTSINGKGYSVIKVPMES